MHNDAGLRNRVVAWESVVLQNGASCTKDRAIWAGRCTKDKVSWTELSEDEPRRLVLLPTKGDEMSEEKELWSGDGWAVGMADKGFTSYKKRVTPDLNAQGKTNAGAGEVVSVDIGFHSQLCSAIKRAAKGIGRDKATDLHSLVKHYEVASDRIVEATKGL